MALWDRIGSRGNVVDRRGSRFVSIGGGLGIGGILLLVAVNYLSGGNVLDVLQQVPIEAHPAQNSEEFEGLDEYEVFAATVLGSNNDMWREQFAGMNGTYTEPTLVLFRNATQSACGIASSDIGPHYCPLDETIYLDETFFDELQRRFGAEGGDVAEAYVIAHEVAHHAQHQLGIMESGSRTDNEASIKLELQADCFAGMWAYSIRDIGVLGPGEIREAMDAAAAVGDDRIQQSTTGRVNPESWTHGSSDERLAWFTRGYESGSVAACDTFADR